MAKMFYTLEEAAERLGKSADEVKTMAESGQIQEFRDRERLMFKVDQIDLLAGGGEGEAGGDELIGLADSTEQEAIELKEESVLGLEDSKISLTDSKESTGISIFDADELEAVDSAAATQVSESIGPMEFSMDSAGSGSGLLDLTREGDDTSLGAVLDDIYPGEEEMDLAGSGTGLFSSEGEEGAEGGGDMMGATIAAPVTVVEAYDGGWSGMGVGFAIGALASLILAAMVLLTNLTGTLAGIAGMMKDGSNYFIYMGALAGATLLLGIVGYFIGKMTD